MEEHALAFALNNKLLLVLFLFSFLTRSSLSEIIFEERFEGTFYYSYSYITMDWLKKRKIWSKKKKKYFVIIIIFVVLFWHVAGLKSTELTNFSYSYFGSLAVFFWREKIIWFELSLVNCFVVIIYRAVKEKRILIME